MKLRFDLTVIVVATSLCILLGEHDACADLKYDLKKDWSDVSNPNGVWSYREGTNALPHVASWRGDPGFGANVQPAWAYSALQSSQEFIPTWFKSAFNPPPSNDKPPLKNDWKTGDVVTHTLDPVNGMGHGPANVTWTSPVSGTVDISGGVWEGRDVGRGNHWTLSLNGVPFTEGDISSGDLFTRANPHDFAVGSGGPSVLNDVPVSIGDVITLQFEKTSEQGDYVGVNFTITAIPTSAQGTWQFSIKRTDGVKETGFGNLTFNADGTVTGYALTTLTFSTVTYTGTWSNVGQGPLSGAFTETLNGQQIPRLFEASYDSSSLKGTVTGGGSSLAIKGNRSAPVPDLSGSWSGTVVQSGQQVPESFMVSPNNQFAGVFDFSGTILSPSGTLTTSGQIIIDPKGGVVGYGVDSADVASSFTGKYNSVAGTMNVKGVDQFGAKLVGKFHR